MSMYNYLMRIHRRDVIDVANICLARSTCSSFKWRKHVLRWETLFVISEHKLSLFVQETERDSRSYIIRYFSANDNYLRVWIHTHICGYSEKKIRKLSAWRTPLCLPHYKLHLRKFVRLVSNTVSDDDDGSCSVFEVRKLVAQTAIIAWISLSVI